MEIVNIRKELTHLLDNITEQSEKYANNTTITSAEVGAVLLKINKAQEKTAVLKYLLEQEELNAKLNTATANANNPINNETIQEPAPIVTEIKVELKPEILQPILEEVAEQKIVEEHNLEQQSILKLADFLTLNDRYLYANELFNKDMSAFNALVKSIDECKSFDEAQKLYILFDWEIENEHVLTFTNLVERRFL